MAAGAFYLVAAAVGGLVALGIFVFVFTSIMGVFTDVRKDFRR
jgi:hypothetical protein